MLARHVITSPKWSIKFSPHPPSHVVPVRMPLYKSTRQIFLGKNKYKMDMSKNFEHEINNWAFEGLNHIGRIHGVCDK